MAFFFCGPFLDLYEMELVTPQAGVLDGSTAAVPEPLGRTPRALKKRGGQAEAVSCKSSSSNHLAAWVRKADLTDAAQAGLSHQVPRP